MLTLWISLAAASAPSAVELARGAPLAWEIERDGAWVAWDPEQALPAGAREVTFRSRVDLPAGWRGDLALWTDVAAQGWAVRADGVEVARDGMPLDSVRMPTWTSRRIDLAPSLYADEAIDLEIDVWIPDKWRSPPLDPAALHPVMIGERATLSGMEADRYARRLATGGWRAALVAGGLVIAVYHLLMWLARREDRPTGWFGAFTLTCLVIVATNVPSLRDLVDDRAVPARVQYAALYAAGATLLMYLWSFRGPVPAWVRGLAVVWGVHVAAFLVIPLAWFAPVAPIHAAWTVIAAPALLGSAALAWREARRDRDVAMQLASLVALTAIGLLDVLGTNLELIGYRSVVLAWFDDRFALALALYLISVAVVLARRHAAANLSLAKYATATGRFVPHEFLALIGHKSVVDVRKGDGVSRTMTVLFSDIRGFTNISEAMTPEQNFEFVNAYLGHMEPIIRAHGGFIDKFIGDAIMALFPTADQAVRAASAMLDGVRAFNDERRGQPAIAIGVGLNTGPLMLGVVGGGEHLEGTVIADAVNLASRIEGLTKAYGASILMSESTRDALTTGEFAVRVVDRVRASGKTKPTTLYEVVHEPALGWDDVAAALRTDVTAARAAIEAWTAAHPADPVGRWWRERLDRAESIDWEAGFPMPK